MFQPGLFREKRILVTGGGTGLGRAMAEAFLALGAEIVICGRRKAVCEATAAELMAAHGGKVSAHGVDIRDAAAVEAMVEEIFREGPLTGLVNNAAGNFISRTEDLSPRGFDAIANIVMHGTFYVTQAVGKRWIAAGVPGSVVSIIVTWVRNGGPFVAPSAMSKAAVQAMTMSLAAEWGRYGIRLNAIAPGEIPTEGMSKRLNPGERAGRAHRGGEPDGPLRHVGGIAEPRDVPAERRLPLADRRDHRDGRRAGARHRRQLLRIAQLGRRRMARARATRSMFQPGLFKEKRILVTGGGTGLGRAMAEAFLALGAEVVICGRRKDVCEATAAELMAAHGGKVTAHGVDIRDAAAVEAMVEEIFREGPLTGLVNNAAGNFISRTEDLSPRGFDAIANIVMHGSFYVTQPSASAGSPRASPAASSPSSSPGSATAARSSRPRR